MTRTIAFLTAASLLAGCAASPQSQGNLNALIQACNAGYQDACYQIPGAQQQVAAEQQANTNAAVAVGVGAALLGGVAAVAASDRGYYRGYDRGRYYRRY